MGLVYPELGDFVRFALDYYGETIYGVARELADSFGCSEGKACEFMRFVVKGYYVPSHSLRPHSKTFEFSFRSLSVLLDHFEVKGDDPLVSRLESIAKKHGCGFNFPPKK